MGEAASNLKETASEKAREVGGAVREFGSKFDDAFKKSKEDIKD